MQSAFNRSVFDRVSLAVKQAVGIRISELSCSTRLVEDLELGRFGRLRFAICIEEIFNIELQDDTIEQFSVLGDVVEYLSCRYFSDVEFPALAVAA